MPYLRITCRTLSAEQRQAIAAQLTESINDLFYQPRSNVSRQELWQRTTVHFTPYQTQELFVGGQDAFQADSMDLTVELSDWTMSVRQQRKVARELTPVLLALFGIAPDSRDSVNIRFHSYPPTDFAVGGTLLADRVPYIGQLAKRLFG